MNTRLRIAWPRRVLLLMALAVVLFTTAATAQTVTNIAIATNSNWQLFRGTNEASAPVDAWRFLNFADAAWETRPAPFHVGTNALGGDDNLTNGTILADMAGGAYTCIFLRQKFVVNNASNVTTLSSRLALDDGIVIYINGVEVRRLFLPAGNLTYTNAATSSREVASALLTLGGAHTNLVEGTNVIAVQVFNHTNWCVSACTPINDDFRFDIEMTMVAIVPPVVTNTTPANGSSATNLTQFTVQFSQNVTNVKNTDLRINNQPSTSVAGAGPTNTYTFTFPAPTTGVAQITWNPAQNIRNTGGAQFAGTNVWTVNHTFTPPLVVGANPPFTWGGPAQAVTNLTAITVNFNIPVIGLRYTDLLINGQSATNVTGGGASWTFEFPQPTPGTVNITWDPLHGITDASGIRFQEATSTWSYTFTDLTPPVMALISPVPGATLASVSELQVTFSEPVSGVDAGDLLINNQPATSLFGSGAGPYLFQFPSPTAGSVQFAWAAGHNIRDLAATPNDFGGGTWTVTLDPAAFTGDIVVNEFLVANVNTNSPLDLDEDNEVQPWIELYNRGTNTVRLLGWSLTNDKDIPDLWTFPDVTLAPGKFLLVYASEKNRKVVGGLNGLGKTNQLHTNFKLGLFGDYFALLSADSPRRVVWEMEYPEQRNDYSYGLVGSNIWLYFATPTPLAINGTSTISQIVPKPHVNAARGLYESPFTLIASCDAPGASMRYTTDGTPPTETLGTPYTGPLTISNTTLFRIIAYQSNALPSRVATFSYIFLNNILSQPTNPPGYPTTWVGTGGGGGTYPSDYEMDPEIVTNTAYAALVKPALKSLPMLVLTFNTNDLFAPATGIYVNPNPAAANRYLFERAISAEFVLTNNEEGFQVDCGVRMQGNASRDPAKTSKHPFRLMFKGAYGEGRLKYQIFPDSPVDSFNTIVLRSDFNNSWLHWDTNQRLRGTRIRDAWGKDSFRAMGQPAAHSRYCHLFLNGLYWGIYEFSERADGDFAANYYGGDRHEYDAIASKPTEAIDGDINAYNTMTTFIRGNNMNVLSNYVRATQLLDITNYVDYIALNFYSANQDWGFDGNWNAVRRRTGNGPFEYLVWDAEQYIVNIADNRVSNTDIPSGLHTNLINSAEYRLLFADRVYKHCFNGGALSSNQNILRWQARAAQLDTAIVVESARWGDNRRDVMTTLGGGTAPFQLYTRDNYWRPEIDRLSTNYFTPRLATYISQLRTANLFPNVTAPVFNQHGGRVAPGFPLTMSGATNTIYFTTNGADPRLFGSNTVASFAQVYTGPLTLNSSVTVKARALFNGTNWSPLLEATFTVGSLGVPLRITELMYNPVGGDPYEFIELQNVGATPLNIGQYYFGGITFAFPVNFTIGAGQRIVLGNNTSTNAWKTRYPSVTPVGWFGGKLSDNGEKITLFDNFNQVVLSVDYDISGGWQGATNGYSLEIINPNGDPDDPANWRTSSAQNGTPGAANAVAPSSAVVINEVAAENLTAVNHGGTFPDWVELYNTGASATNIAGWSITDDGTARKFVFPANTIIPAGGYLVVWCDATTNTTPGIHTGFSLGKNGDNVFLYDQNTNRVDAITFGPQVSDYSIGRVSGTWTLTTPTTSAPNVAATVASSSSLYINEWLANAAPGGNDWFELFNSSSNAPAGLKGLYAGTTNALYQFTALSFIAPRGFLQLIADENPGGDHVDFKLIGAGGAIVLYDNTGAEFRRVSYAAQAEGVSSGYFPDGTTNLYTFAGSASPGASNYLNNYTGPLMNEVLAKNSSTVSPFGDMADFVELFNNSASPFNLGGMGLSDEAGKVKFVFAPGTTVAANSYLVVWCDSGRADMTNAPVFNASFALNGDSGALYLFNTNGQVVQSLDYGFQIADMPLGYSAGNWLLLSNATPGAANAAAAALGSVANLFVNEWFANPLTGSSDDDWFELFNNDPLPVNMAGIYLTDDPSLVGLSNSVVAPLSFIAGKGWAKFVADGKHGAGHHHVTFDLDKSGELIRIYNTDFSIIDTVSFGAQADGVSQGRLPDGGTNITNFPLTPTPGSANYLPHPGIVVNEVLTHTDAPFEDAIELQNVGTNSVDISGWWMSNSERAPGKFQVPASTVLAPGQFKVFYENQFNPDGTGNSPGFTLNSAHGDAVYVSEADGSGALTGYRAQVSFGAAENGVSFGRFRTSVGVDFTALAQRTFGVDSPSTLAQFRTGTGASNSYAKVGPVVISEINYHPVNAVNGTNLVENPDEEFVELQNITGSLVTLYDPARPANVWKLSGGVSFKFATNQTLAPGAYLIVANFNPTNIAALNSFRAKYGNNGVIVGPFSGRLNNSGDVVELYKPDAPQAAPHPDVGYVPQILVDRVAYSDISPWPTAADGGGASLQKISSSLYGNDPANWKAEPATAGRTNTQSGAVAPTIATQPSDATATVGGSASFVVAVNGTAPFVFQWRHANTNLPGATNATLNLTNVQLTDAGDYRVFVTNSAGSILSDAATLTVVAPPQITQQPTNTTVIAGNTAQFAVTASGSSPLGYFWYRNGVEIIGANNSTLSIPAAQPANGGNYFVVVSNAAGTATSQVATLTIIVPAAVTGDPVDATVLVNTPVSFGVSASGTAPLSYQWRKNGVNIPGATGTTYTISSAQPSHEGAYSCIVSNGGGTDTSTSAQLTVSVAPVLGTPYWRTVGGPPVPVLEFFITGASNYSYAVDYSTNLTTWSNFTTVTLIGTKSTNVMDYGATNSRLKFYRARVQ